MASKRALWQIQSGQTPGSSTFSVPFAYVVPVASSLDQLNGVVTQLGSPLTHLPVVTPTTPGVDMPFYWQWEAAAEHSFSPALKKRKGWLSVSNNGDFLFHSNLNFLTATVDTSPLFFSDGKSLDLTPNQLLTRRRRAQLTSAILAQENVRGIFTQFINGSVYSADSCSLLEEIQRHLLEPVIDKGVSWSLWTQAEVLGFLNLRIQRFFIETGLIRKEDQVPAGAGDLAYPSDLMEARRLAYRELEQDTDLTPVSFWFLEEATGTRFDEFDKNPLVPFNAPGTATGKIGNAVSLIKASNQAVYIPNSAQSGLNPGLNDFSMAAWIYPTVISGASNYSIINKGATNFPGALSPGYNINLQGTGTIYPGAIHVDFGSVDVNGLNPNLGLFCTYNIFPPLNTWSHLAFTFDRNGVCAAYLNGVRDTTLFPGFAAVNGDQMNRLADTTGNCQPTAPFTIGGFGHNGTSVPAFGNFDGRIDAVIFDNVLWTQAQIDFLYNGGAGRQIPNLAPPDTSVTDNLYGVARAFWRLEEVTGLRKDTTHNINDLAPNNGPLGAPGIVGNAVLYPGIAAESLSISTSSTLDPQLANWSISTWIYQIDPNGAPVEYLVAKGASSDAAAERAGYNVGITNSGNPFPNRIQVYFGAAAGVARGGYAIFNSVIPTNQWVHVVVVFNRTSTIQCYINSVEITSLSDGSANISALADSTGPVSTIAPFALGINTTSVGLGIQGLVGRQDATGIFPIALNQAQVNALYVGGSGLELPFTPAPTDPPTPTPPEVISISPLERLDDSAADNSYINWENVTGTPVAFAEEPKNALTFQLIPPPSASGDVDILYVPLPDAITSTCVPLPFPNFFANFIKWGVMADMLSKEGEANDPARSAAAELRFREGIELAKALLGTAT